MTPKKNPVTRRGLLLGLLLILAGCGHAYVNPDITDPAEAKNRLKADMALCRQEANEAMPPSYGQQRFTSDPTVEAQATQALADTLEDDRHLDAYSRCMRQRGWRYRK